MRSMTFVGFPQKCWLHQKNRYRNDVQWDLLQRQTCWPWTRMRSMLGLYCSSVLAIYCRLQLRRSQLHPRPSHQLQQWQDDDNNDNNNINNNVIIIINILCSLQCCQTQSCNMLQQKQFKKKSTCITEKDISIMTGNFQIIIQGPSVCIKYPLLHDEW